jgi:SNF2 family DNA or RNA helicase
MQNGVKKAPWGALAYFGGKKKLAGIHKAMESKASRIKIDELGDAFPDNETYAQAYDCGDVQGIYDSLTERLAELERSKAKDRPHPMTEILRARQEAELVRVPVLLELAQSLLDEDKSVVVFCNFRNSLDTLSLELKNCSMIWGGQREDERQKMIDDFQNNINHVMLCQIQSGGVGVSLHDLNGRPRSSLICPTYSAIDLKQALGRIHRAGAKSKAIQRIVFAADSIEEKVMRKVRAKLHNIETLNDGDIETI